jgi:hypothetical protein
MSMVDDARASPIMSDVIPPDTVKARYLSIAAKRRSRRTLDRIRLSGSPR